MKARLFVALIIAIVFLISASITLTTYYHNKDCNNLSLWMFISFVSLLLLCGNGVVLFVKSRYLRK